MSWKSLADRLERPAEFWYFASIYYCSNSDEFRLPKTSVQEVSAENVKQRQIRDPCGPIKRDQSEGVRNTQLGQYISSR